MGGRFKGLIGAALLLLTITGTSTAAPTSPGTNGNLLFVKADPDPAVSDGDLFVIDPQGGVAEIPDGGTDAFGGAYSPDGTRIAFAGGVGQYLALYVMDSDGSDLTKLTQGHFDGSPVWSPNGQTVAFTRFNFNSPDVFRSSIWSVGADGSALNRLVRGRTINFEPNWSPDGLTISWVRLASKEHKFDIYRMGADGSNKVDLTDLPGSEVYHSWSPDGTKITYIHGCGHCSGADRNGEIETLDLTTGDRTSLTHNDADEESPRWSPDGSKIAFLRCRFACFVYVMDSDGPNKMRIENDDQDRTNYEWSPDSSLIAYSTRTPEGYKIFIARSDGSGTSKLLTDPSEMELNSWQAVP